MSDKDGLAQLQRENRALELRHKHGMTFASIARELGYETIAGAHKAYKRAMKRVEHPDAKELFGADLDRLDQLTETFWESARQGNMRSAEMILHVIDRRADYLDYKSPTRIQAEVNHYGNGSIDAEVVQLARIIDYIEGVASDITTLPSQPSEGEQNHVAEVSAEGTITA